MTLVSLAIVSVVAIAFVPWPGWLRLLLIAMYAAAIALGVMLMRQAGRVEWLEWKAEGIWYLKTTQDENPAVAELRDFRLFGLLVSLDMRIGLCRRLITLWPDSAESDGLRRLRIRLQREGIVANKSPPAGAVR